MLMCLIDDDDTVLAEVLVTFRSTEQRAYPKLVLIEMGKNQRTIRHYLKPGVRVGRISTFVAHTDDCTVQLDVQLLSNTFADLARD